MILNTAKQNIKSAGCDLSFMKRQWLDKLVKYREEVVDDNLLEQEGTVILDAVFKVVGLEINEHRSVSAVLRLASFPLTRSVPVDWLEIIK